MATPDLDIAKHLSTNVIGLQKGVNLFAGPVRATGVDIPDCAVFCGAGGGPAPAEFIRAGAVAEERFSTVQVRIRSSGDDLEGGQTLARSVRDSVHRASISPYIAIYVNETEPNYLGQTEKGHHNWTINAELHHVE